MAFLKEKNTHARVMIDGKEITVSAKQVRKTNKGFDVDVMEVEEVHDEEARADVEELIARWKGIGKTVVAHSLDEIGLWKIFVQVNRRVSTVAVDTKDVEFFAHSPKETKYTVDAGTPSRFATMSSSSTGFINAVPETTPTGRIPSERTWRQMPSERFTSEDVTNSIEQLQVELSRLREEGAYISEIPSDPTPAHEEPMETF